MALSDKLSVVFSSCENTMKTAIYQIFMFEAVYP